jgi:hypothetical protein
LTATLVIDAAAATGARNVTVSTVSGTSGAVTFTVTLSAPRLLSISPSSGIQGTSVPVTLTGTNFVFGATTLAISGTGVTGASVSVTSATSLTATLVIDAAAATGSRNVTVSTASGTSGTVTFTVNSSALPDLAATGNVVPTVVSGTAQSYNVNITTQGTGPADNVTVTHNLQAGFTID